MGHILFYAGAPIYRGKVEEGNVLAVVDAKEDELNGDVRIIATPDSPHCDLSGKTDLGEGMGAPTGGGQFVPQPPRARVCRLWQVRELGRRSEAGQARLELPHGLQFHPRHPKQEECQAPE